MNSPPLIPTRILQRHQIGDLVLNPLVLTFLRGRVLVAIEKQMVMHATDDSGDHRYSVLLS